MQVCKKMSMQNMPLLSMAATFLQCSALCTHASDTYETCFINTILNSKMQAALCKKNVRIRSIPLKDAAVSSRCAMSETHNFHLRDAVLVCRQKDA